MLKRLLILQRSVKEENIKSKELEQEFRILRQILNNEEVLKLFKNYDARSNFLVKQTALFEPSFYRSFTDLFFKTARECDKNWTGLIKTILKIEEITNINNLHEKDRMDEENWIEYGRERIEEFMV